MIFEFLQLLLVRRNLLESVVKQHYHAEFNHDRTKDLDDQDLVAGVGQESARRAQGKIRSQRDSKRV